MTSKQLQTKKAIQVYNYGGVVQMESAPGTWITIHNPMFLEGMNFRPFKMEPVEDE